MRYMTIVKVPEYTGAPPAELQAAMGTLIGEMMQKGLLVDMGGLTPMSRGALLRLSRGKVSVVDGPFAETKEIIGGYAIFRLSSRDEAIELGRRFLQLHADVLGPTFEAALEIREMDDPAAEPAGA